MTVSESLYGLCSSSWCSLCVLFIRLMHTWLWELNWIGCIHTMDIKELLLFCLFLYSWYEPCLCVIELFAKVFFFQWLSENQFGFGVQIVFPQQAIRLQGLSNLLYALISKVLMVWGRISAYELAVCTSGSTPSVLKVYARFKVL